MTLNQDITTSRTLSVDTAYTISGFVHVLNAATLTIQPGTIFSIRTSEPLDSRKLRGGENFQATVA